MTDCCGRAHHSCCEGTGQLRTAAEPIRGKTAVISKFAIGKLAAYKRAPFSAVARSGDSEIAGSRIHNNE